MYWIYVLKCENDITYVGQTIHLYKRLSEHYHGKASTNTKNNKPLSIIGLYKVDMNVKFMDFMMGYISNLKEELLFEKLDNIAYMFDINKEDAENIENYITETLMLYKDYKLIRGGRYLRGDLEPEYTKERHNRTQCKCGLPCEVRYMKQGSNSRFIYVCPLKNIWPSMREEFKLIPINDACTYYEEYMEPIEVLVSYKSYTCKK